MTRFARLHLFADKLGVVKVYRIQICRIQTRQATVHAGSNCCWRVVKIDFRESIAATFCHLLNKLTHC